MTKYSFITLIFCLLTGGTTALIADDAAMDADTDTFFIPKAQQRYSEEQACVEPIEEMRTNHMEYILDQRDNTVHEGVRTKQHSLVECINCHVSDAPDAPRIDSEKHFCSSCHTYASVNIDCFQCHADRPMQQTSYFHSLSRDSNHHISSDMNASAVTMKDLQLITNEGTGNE